MKNYGVLVVDADKEVLAVIARLLGHFQQKVDCVKNAASALDRLKNRNYRTMIISLNVPDMAGLELASKAQERFPNLNVIMFTGSTPEQVMLQVLDPKVSDISDGRSTACGLDYMMGIVKSETGRIFLLE
jgi:CheY-like chemotaxis protein